MPLDKEWDEVADRTVIEATVLFVDGAVDLLATNLGVSKCQALDQLVDDVLLGRYPHDDHIAGAAVCRSRGLKTPVGSARGPIC